MAFRESFYTKQQPRFYKEAAKPGKNTKEFRSQINPLQHSDQLQENQPPSSASSSSVWASRKSAGPLGSTQKKNLKYHAMTTNNIFGESTNTQPSWLASPNHSRRGSNAPNYQQRETHKISENTYMSRNEQGTSGMHNGSKSLNGAQKVSQRMLLTGQKKTRELQGSNPIGNHTQETNFYEKRFLNSQKQARAKGVSQSNQVTQSIHGYQDNDRMYGVLQKPKENKMSASLLMQATGTRKETWAPKVVCQWVEPKGQKLVLG